METIVSMTQIAIINQRRREKFEKRIVTVFCHPRERDFRHTTGSGGGGEPSAAVCGGVNGDLGMRDFSFSANSGGRPSISSSIDLSGGCGDSELAPDSGNPAFSLLSSDSSGESPSLFSQRKSFNVEALRHSVPKAGTTRNRRDLLFFPQRLF